MKFTTFLSASLSCLFMTQVIYAEPSAAQQDAAAVASRLDTDPAANGSISEQQALSDSAVQEAAVASRRDSDPALNDSPLSDNLDVALKR